MITRDFITAGDATFTVTMPDHFTKANQTPGHYTYKVEYAPASGNYPEGWFIKFFTGTDNENPRHYSYLGMLRPHAPADATLDELRQGLVRLTAKSKLPATSWPVQVLCNVLARLWLGHGKIIAAAGWDVKHEGRCGRCGRKLTHPDSIDTGIGPECQKILAGAA